MASARCQKPTATTEICQPKNHHSSLGHKISEMTSKAFKGHHARYGSTQNQLQRRSQTLVDTSSKTETRGYSQTQTQHLKDHGVVKTEITLCFVQAHITQTTGNHTARGTTTTCRGDPTKKNKKDKNLFRRIRDGISRHGSDSDNSSESESDNEN